MAKLNADTVQAILDCDEPNALLTMLLEMEDEVREQLFKFLRKLRKSGANSDLLPSASPSLSDCPASVGPPAGESAARPLSTPTAIAPPHVLRRLDDTGWACGPSEDQLEPMRILPEPPDDAPPARRRRRRAPELWEDPPEHFVRSDHVLFRPLRHLADGNSVTCGQELAPHWEHNEYGERDLSDEQLTATLTCHGANVRLVIFAGGADPTTPADGQSKLAARFESGKIVKGRVNPETWERIVAAIAA